MSGAAKPGTARSWQAVEKELRRRISERVWSPGEFIPAEIELAEEFGCARATVNRAMRELADAGLLERRRKAGTRVVKNPVRRATLDIPITRIEIEQRGARWHHTLLEHKVIKPPAIVASQLSLHRQARALHLRSLHFADRRPYLYEDRWVNTAAVPAIEKADLNAISANEWLVQHAPFTGGELTLSATNANNTEAEMLGTSEGVALVVIDRITFNGDEAITCVRLAYAPGYRIQTKI